jgi:hypothetical protein
MLLLGTPTGACARTEMHADTVIGVYDDVSDWADDALREPIPQGTNRNRAFWRYFLPPPVRYAALVAAGKTENIGTQDPAWFGIETKDCDARGVAAWLTEGWTEGAHKATRFAAELTLPPMPVPKRRGAWRDRGDELSIERVYSGDIDEAWRTTEKKALIDTPRVHMLVQVGQHAGMNAEAAFFAFAAAMTLIESLASCGYAVRVDAFIYGRGVYLRNGVAHAAVRVGVKNYAQPLNPSYLAAVLGHASVQRRLGFLWYAAACPKGSEIHYGAGSCIPIPDDIQALFTQDNGGAYVIVVPPSLRDKDAANAWLAETASKMLGQADGTE